MKRVLTIIFIGFLIVGSFGFGWDYLHQRTLSPEVKAAVIAALDDNATSADQVVYLRAAKLAIRTKKDADVVGRLNKMVMLVLEYQENDRADWESIRRTTTRLRDSRIDNCIANLTPNSVAAESEYCKSLIQADKDQIKADQELDKNRSEAEKYEISEGKRLFKELRAEMKLPPSANVK